MVEKGGVLITVGACHEGIGSDYFFKLAAKYPTPNDALTAGLKDDSFGIHKLIKTARQLRNFSIYYVTNLDEDMVKRVYFNPFKDLGEALKQAVAIIGGKPDIAILEDAGNSVPIIEP